jgi:hypothetical protein
VRFGRPPKLNAHQRRVMPIAEASSTRTSAAGQFRA